MIKNKKIILMGTILFVSLATFLSAENKDIKKLVNPAYYDELVKNQIVTVIKDDGSNKLELIPESTYSNKLKGNLIKKNPKNYPFTYESLYLKSKKSLLESSKSSKNTFGIDEISKVCRSISKMEGMLYYSTSRKKTLELYDRAYMLESADPNAKRIPDQNEGNADGQVSYCVQNDTSFGECRYQLNYYQTDNELMSIFTNLDTLGMGPFKAIYPGLMTMNIIVIDCGDDILFYICCDLDSVKFPGIKGQITESMSNRMDAVYNWFIKQF